MKGQLATFRAFPRFCATIDAVELGLDEKNHLPTITADDAREELLDAERARKVLDHIERIGTRRWSTYSSRFSGIRAFELGQPSGLTSTT